MSEDSSSESNLPPPDHSADYSSSEDDSNEETNVHSWNSSDSEGDEDSLEENQVEYNTVALDQEGMKIKGKRQRNEEGEIDQPSRKKKKKRKNEDELTEEEKLQAKKFERGEKINTRRIRDRKIRGNLQKTERLAQKAVREAVKAQVLLTEEAGYLEPEGVEETHLLSQKDLLPHVDLQTASKMFDLVLDQLGPYNFDFSHNGKHLLLCGRRGHVAMLNWTTKDLMAELHLNETCKDIKFLHNYMFFAVAQKRHAYIYDNHGAEIHKLDNMNTPNALDFLRHHFLLVSVNEGGCLRYQDTSTGALVANHYTGLGPCHVLRQNPWNAVINLGHKNGTVTMWAPASNEPLVKMQCHAGPVTSLAVDSTGKYLVTGGRDNRMKIWDVRTYKELYSYYTPVPASTVDISQRGVISLGCGNVVQMWKNCFQEEQSKPYMQHRLRQNRAESVRFCPYEDFLGVGHSGGYSSVVVPGSGEPNFDSFAANPYQTPKQRRETEVQALLDKIQPEMIQLDPRMVGTLAPTANPSNEESNRFLNKPEKESKPKNKMRGKNTSSKRANLKQQNVWDKNRELRREQAEKKEKNASPAVSNKNIPRALSRFK